MSRSPEPGVAIDAVVVSYNSRDTLRACAEPLVALPRVAVTVVDNASPDDSLEAIADLPVRAIEAGRNGGFGAGCNLGMAAGSAPLVLLLNPDARIDAADLDRLVAVLDAEPDVALVGPRLLDDDGELIPSLRRYQRTASMWAQALFLHRLLPRARWANEIDVTPEAYERIAYPEWISGACMLARRTALEAIGGFDEEFFLYCEDMDLCARLTAAGHRIRYEPGATVRHVGGHSAPRSSLLPVLVRSRVRYARKHGGRRAMVLQRAALVVDSLTHLVTAARRPAYARGRAAALREGLSREPA
jgi:N-acetylglucosaminyl-diphospho-decaprenol L-rhamnosyltransferase